VQFLTGRVGWVAAGGLRGLVSFVDPVHGWCVAPHPMSTPLDESLPFRAGQDVALFRTADGGAHWSQLLATDEQHPVSAGLSNEGQKVWVWFRDAEAGWIGESGPGGHAVIYATADGGDTWNRQELPSPNGGWGSTLGTYEEGPQTAGGRSSPSLVASTVQPGPQPRQFVLAARYVYTWRSSGWTRPAQVPDGTVWVADEARWLVATSTSVLGTTDGGESWLALGEVPPGWLAVTLQIADPDHGWAVLIRETPSGTAPPSGGLARTLDGGRHWSLVALPS
jgi:hypothetical protein